MSARPQEPKAPVRHLYNYWDEDGTHWVAWCGRYVAAPKEPADKARLVDMRVPKLAKGACKMCVRAWEEA